MAAGQSSRFGSFKPLACLPDGNTLLSTTYSRIRQVTEHCVVVSAPQHTALHTYCLAQGIPFWTTPVTTRSLGQSIGLAVRAHGNAGGWLIALADMPAINAATYQQILNSMRSDRIVRPVTLDGCPGHPVGFGSDFYQPLVAQSTVEAAHSGGSRAILARHADKLDQLVCNDPGIVLDIDRPSDIKHHHSLR